MSIDVGVDLVCWKSGVPKQIQVKTRKEKPKRLGFFVYAISERSLNVQNVVRLLPNQINLFESRKVDQRKGENITVFLIFVDLNRIYFSEKVSIR